MEEPDVKLRMHPAYEALVEKAEQSHRNHRNPAGIGEEDVCRARLYAYALRMHVIGAFHATRVAIEELPSGSAAAAPWRLRAIETLEDLAGQTIDPVPRDYRAVIGTLYRYHRGIQRVLDSLRHDAQASRDEKIRRIAGRFRETVEEITAECGIHLARDTTAPEQASFVVPNLGIVIVPLVYGDHHSWNLAWLAGERRNVPTHRHHHGVEIHLGYNPTHGMTVLGRHRAAVDDGYAMPIPPETDHGWVNTGDTIHHVPFIFGSLVHGGWGVFLDVEPQTEPLERFELRARTSPAFAQMVDLEHWIAKAEAMRSSWRTTLIPHTVTARSESGGLELNLTRANPGGYNFAVDSFRIVSIVRGSGVVSIEGIERAVTGHDHFGVPAGMKASLRPTGDEALIALDALIRPRS